GAPVEASADEAAWLERESTCNPFLWRRAELEARLRTALLAGGVHVLGRAAYRFALPGDGEVEFWLLADGTPVGYALRDPVRKARVERHLVGTDLRTIVDGALEPGWATRGVMASGTGAGTVRQR